MKNRWILLAAAALYSCGSRTAQTTVQAEAAPEPIHQVVEPKERLTGAYGDQRPLRTNEEQLFDVLTSKIDSVRYTAKSVAAQVVAGTNYKYLCTAEPKSGGKPYLVELVIYLPLPNSGKMPVITRIERCNE